MKKCRITILRRTLNQDFIDSYRVGPVLPCEYFKEGQEFVLETPFEMPENFCSWAWGDIRHDILVTMLEGKRPWVSPSDVAITCCTDGYRPVFFKIEGAD